jgi:hypothetical protein
MDLSFAREIYLDGCFDEFPYYPVALLNTHLPRAVSFPTYPSRS